MSSIKQGHVRFVAFTFVQPVFASVCSQCVTVPAHRITLIHFSNDVGRVSLIHEVRNREALVLGVSVVKVNADNRSLIYHQPTIHA